MAEPEPRSARTAFSYRRFLTRCNDAIRQFLKPKERETVTSLLTRQLNYLEAQDIPLGRVVTGDVSNKLDMLQSKKGLSRTDRRALFRSVLQHLSDAVQALQFQKLKEVVLEHEEIAPLDRVSDASSVLNVLIDPGSASSEEIAELLVEISTLYRMMGGSGLKFTRGETRQPAAVGA